MADGKTEISDLTIPKNDSHVYGDWINEVPETCSAAGTCGHYECSLCHKYFDASKNEIATIEIPVDSTAHVYGAWIAEVPATCESEGTKAHKDCSLCGKHFDNANAEITDLSIAKNDNHDLETVWTATADGHYHKCKREGCKDNGKVDFAAHTPDRSEATEENAVKCTVCDYIITPALGLERYMEGRYDRRIRESYVAVEKTNFYDAVYSPVVVLLNAAVVGIVMLLSASGKAEILSLFGMSVGTSVAVINYISKIFSPIESLGMEIQTIQSAMAGVKRIDAFLEQPERTIPTESDNETRGDIVFSHVTFGYGGKPALNDFSMTVKEGEQVTLVGRTGAGKSTVFRLLMGLYQPEAGRITIGGVDISEITDSERRTCIGCVEQHFSRVPGTVLEQITLGDLQITEEMAQKAAELAGIDEAIRALPDGYHTICTDGMFSQGEWQLLSIARAAAADPAVLLLDEITANLDAETEAHVLDALRRASEGRTVLSISHRIYENLGGRTVEIKAHSV